jgi:hypothetical protein
MGILIVDFKVIVLQKAHFYSLMVSWIVNFWDIFL